jgi:hypothetical protein
MLCSQVQRSGGTLLTRLFDGHPACFAHPNELRWGRSQKWRWPQLDVQASLAAEDLFAQLDEGWQGKFAKSGYQKYSNWTHRHHPEQTRKYPFLFDVALQRTLFADATAELRAPRQRDILDCYLTSLFNAWLDYQNLYRTPKEWVTAFLPRLVMKPREVDRFFADYPDGLLVTIIRDPGSWLASFRRHVEPEDLAEALQHWIVSADASLDAHTRRPDRVIVLLFEDLVHRTEAVMRTLCEHMKIAFDAILLEPTYNSMPVLSDSSYQLVTGIDPRTTQRHQSTLSAAEIELVSRDAAPRYTDIRRRFAIT